MRALFPLTFTLFISALAFCAEPKPDKFDNPGSLHGLVPVGRDGKPLNLDFETGTLADWSATGEAFNKQPIQGDTVFPRRSDMKSNHLGQYWIGSYEADGDKPRGTLTSAPFKVNQPFASFLVGGGPNEETRVEICIAEAGTPPTSTQAVIFKTTGFEMENLSPIAVDLRPHQGKEIFIRIVDDHSGHWGHINFDHFRFHTEQPNFPNRPVQGTPPPTDVVKNAGLTPQQAAREMTLPPGFSATVFAAEPDLTQPVALAIDHRGRLWVAEAHSYPKRQPEGQGKDRILIFEDADGDGVAEKKTLFADKLNLVSGLEIGFGGVYVGAAPWLLFIPDKDGDDKPDSAPQILLDGFGYQDTHETLNSFIWGPDGWLYGCHGVFTYSNVGRPGTPDNQRTKINAGIWRYHPTKNVFEVFAEGTSNPWGVDFNDHGQAFATACVIPHLYHIIQGARYQRQAGKHFNPHIYKDIQTIGDHVHYAGTGGPHAGNNRSDAAGGGHAHCGAMIYLGDSWPAQYRNTLFMSNIHGNRINNDLPERRGSGYVGKHGADLLKMNDKFSRLINVRYGPDGSVYMMDWYDKQACHLNDPAIWDHSNGRLYKIAYSVSPSPSQGEGRGEGKSAPATAKPQQPNGPIDLSKLPDTDLIKLHESKNDFHVRHARTILMERGPRPEVHAALSAALKQSTDPTRRLRYLWTLHATAGLTDDHIASALKDSDEFVRSWAIQLAAEDNEISPALLADLVKLSQSDPSPTVRLYLASACQRLPNAQRWDILANLLKHSEDAEDHNLPLMVWYALEPLAATDGPRALRLAATSKLPSLREFTARRMASTAK